ncbi:TPA: helix-turn-helix domain-containing protein [Escherichia coli]|nr:helix-turn-helix domain-containing protein [Escherichia coli]
MKEGSGGHKVAYTVNEFCAVYGIGRSLCYDEMSSGRLPARKAGRRTLILKTDADKWLSSLPARGEAA